MLKSDPRHPLWLVCFGVICVGLGAAVIWDMNRPPEGPPSLLHELVPVTLNVSEAPCQPERYELACKLYVDEGYLPCVVSLVEGTPVTGDVELLPDGIRAAIAIWNDDSLSMIHPPTACDTEDPTIEHELGHLYGLDDGGPQDCTMASPVSRTGFDVPALDTLGPVVGGRAPMTEDTTPGWFGWSHAPN